MTYKFTSVKNVLEGTNNGNWTNNISKKAQISYYVKLTPDISCEVKNMMNLHGNC